MAAANYFSPKIQQLLSSLATCPLRTNDKEDAVYIKELSDCIIMACADGHGDSRCTYAARGAELAVRIIVSELERIRAESDDTEDFGERKI